MAKQIKILFSFSLSVILSCTISIAQTYYKIKPHPSASSSNADENCPVLTREGMVFSSDKNQGGIQTRTGRGKVPISHLYAADLKKDGNWSPARLFSESLTNQDNQAAISFNLNEDMAIFTRNYDVSGFGNKRGGNPNFGLYFSSFDGTNWTDVKEFQYNDHAFNFMHPTLSPMGDILYFVSNMPGGFGGYDIYVSKMVNGSWSQPENLGPVVNSSENEIYPFLHASGRLYFSSNGHDNRTDYDIFYTDLFQGRWFSPVKLPSPINSGADDFTYVANEDFSYGLFTSKRRGSVDVFTFETTLPQFELCKKQVPDNYCYVFYEENTVSLDTNLYVYEWNLGDGNKVMATEAEYCYAGPGDYMVQLNVVDRLTGLVEFNQAEYLVEVRKVIQPYISGPDTAIINNEIQVHGTESYLGDAKPGEFYWDFGDGNKAVGATARHIYKSPGQFTLKLGIIEDNISAPNPREFCSYKTIIINEN